ncbi:hypothetical protein Tco_0549283 [Tanacetum coccineum]
MVTLKFADTHNMVAFLSKPIECDGFEQIVDFLNAHPIRYALTVNPTIYISCIKQFWSTVKAKTINGEAQLHARVDGKKIIITESSVRRDLRLADEEGVDCLPNSTIFEQLALMGDPTDNVADEAVHKELGNSLVRAATTASSLEAEQDSVGLTARVESSDNEESLGEDASKQGRIDAIDVDEEITLVSVHDVNVSAGEEVFATIVNDNTLAQIMRDDGKSQMYMIFSQMLKSFNREDLEDLYKLVKAKYE